MGDDDKQDDTEGDGVYVQKMGVPMRFAGKTTDGAEVFTCPDEAPVLTVDPRRALIVITFDEAGLPDGVSLLVHPATLRGEPAKSLLVGAHQLLYRAAIGVVASARIADGRDPITGALGSPDDMS